MAKTTKAQARATKKYQSRVYAQVCYKIRKDFKAELERHAQATGESINGFITRAVVNQMKEDAETGKGKGTETGTGTGTGEKSPQ